MSGPRAILLAAVAVGCWGLVLACAPSVLRAAVLPALTMPDETGPSGTRRHGRHGGLLHQVGLLQKTPGVDVIIDDATGIRLGIPYRLVGPPLDVKTKRTIGREWNAPGAGRRLSINTLRVHGLSLEQLRHNLANLGDRSGNVKSTTIPGGFILEGTESKGQSSLYVEVRSQGGEIRGLSVVYTSRFRAELAPVIEDIKMWFDPFPKSMAVAPPTPPPDSRPELLKELTEAEERERRARREAEEAKREAEAAKDRAEKALQKQAQEHALELKKERDLLEWKQKVIEDAHKKAQEQALALFQKLGEFAKDNQSQIVERDKPKDGPMLPGLPQGKRVAFVVGIDAYAHLTRLVTARNDAAAMAATLRGHGFSVIEALDVDRRGFYAKWSQFLGEVEAGGTVAYFFAGHGIQIDARNFLLPTDAPDASVGLEMAREMSISFNGLREDIQKRSPGLSLFILDACRDNPFTRTRGLTRGLARVDVQSGSGTFVMYSAAEGQLALDRLPNEGAGTNSVYVRKLLPWLKQENITLQEIAAYVHNEVETLAATIRHKQAPRYDSGIGPICWSGRCPARTVQVQKQ